MNEPASFVHGSTNGCRNELLNKPDYMPALESRHMGLSHKTLCMDSVQHLPNGETVNHYDVHNLYGWSHSKPTLDALRQITGERGIVISRSTYPSSGQWVGHWLGDNTAAWDQVAKSIIGLMDFSLFGVSYTGADICGFFQNSNRELCARWMQLGAFYPFSRNHNGIGWTRQDPVSFDEAFETLSRNVLNIRYTLLPYLYTLLYDAHTKGSTVVRPLLHEFTEDRNTWDVYKQFLWGSAFMISAVLDQGATSVNAYFTDTAWYDYHTGFKENTRGGWKVLPAPIDHINLHVRGGYILPQQAPAFNTQFSRLNPLKLLVALDDNENANGHLFWDDGKSIDSIEQSIYILYEFSATSTSISLEVTLDGYTDPNNLIFDEIKILGLKIPITYLVVRKDGVIQPSSHQLLNDEANQIVRITDLNLLLGESYTLEYDDNKRVDCHPEPNASKESCESRGCLWIPVSTPGIPYCFYPFSY